MAHVKADTVREAMVRYCQIASASSLAVGPVARYCSTAYGSARYGHFALDELRTAVERSARLLP